MRARTCWYVVWPRTDGVTAKQVAAGNRDLTSPYEVVGFAGSKEALAQAVGPKSTTVPPTFLPNGVYARIDGRTARVKTAGDVQGWARGKYQGTLNREGLRVGNSGLPCLQLTAAAQGSGPVTLRGEQVKQLAPACTRMPVSMATACKWRGSTQGAHGHNPSTQVCELRFRNRVLCDSGSQHK